MRLPKPKLRLPGLSLPFLKSKGTPATDDPLDDAGDEPLPEDAGGLADDIGVDDASALAEPPKRSGSGKRIAAMVGTGLLAALVMGGTGTLVGWLWVNAEHTESMRVLKRPQLTVAILNEGEEPEPNTTAVSAEPETTPEAGSAESTTAEAEETMPDGPKDGVVLTAVDPELLEVKNGARLPVIALDGRQPWSTYARPFNVDDGRPRVAILLMNLGLSQRDTDAAIQLLPGEVTLSFSPYADDLERWLTLARTSGHEVFVDLPLEPLDFPRDDPGPATLLTSLSTPDNLNRLEWVLGRAPGYVGVATWMGSQFTTVEDAMMPVLEGLKERGVMFVDSRGSSRSIATELASSIQLPRAFNNRFLDATPSIAFIDRALVDLVADAQAQGVAIGVARPLPVSIDRISRWAETLDAKGLVLAPVSSIADQQRLR